MRKVVRENDARTASIHPNSVVAQGSFKLVRSGEYVDGHRNGQPCVAKTMLDPQLARQAFDTQLEITQKARELIKKFNDAHIIDKQVVLNIPEVWEHVNGSQMLVEPFLKHFENFNSNTGHVTESSSPWAKVMQALSHFSYHVSSGQFLLCDLQGAASTDKMVLSDPAVLSRNGRFGPTDLGSEGIENFFHWHMCNEYCLKNWQVPKKARYYHQPRLGTSMTDGRSLIVPSSNSTTRSSLNSRIPTLHVAQETTRTTMSASDHWSEPDTPSCLLPKGIFSEDRMGDSTPAAYTPGSMQRLFDAGPAHTSKDPMVSADAAPFLPSCTSQRVESVSVEAPQTYNPLARAPNTAQYIHDDVPAVPTDSSLPADVAYAPGSMQPQDEDQGSVLDMWLQGKQFVEHASAIGIISDPAELARNFMRPQVLPEQTYSSSLMRHRNHEKLGLAVLGELDKLLNNPICSIEDIEFVQEGMTSRIEQARARLHRQNQQLATEPELLEQVHGTHSEQNEAGALFTAAQREHVQQQSEEPARIRPVTLKEERLDSAWHLLPTGTEEQRMADTMQHVPLQTAAMNAAQTTLCKNEPSVAAECGIQFDSTSATAAVHTESPAIKQEPHLMKGTSTVKQDLHLTASETMTSGTATEQGTSQSPKGSGVLGDIDGDDLTEAELAAAMRAVLKVRKQGGKR